MKWSSMMCGPASYTTEHIERVHAHLGISEEAFYESVDMLKDTLDEHDFQNEDIQTVENEMVSYKNFVVTKS